jgi:hypothetical protein
MALQILAYLFAALVVLGVLMLIGFAIGRLRRRLPD